MAMENYPRNMSEFEQLFSDEDACIDYLVKVRWPSGVTCSYCGCKRLWRSGLLFSCAACKQQTRIMAGTIFQDTHLPLRTWFRAIWWVVTPKNGASALSLHRLLGVSYKTAWSLLHKLRRAMVRPGRSRLEGAVEVDEAYVGGLEEGVTGRQANHKALVAIAVQENGKKIGRIRMRVIDSASGANLLSFIEDNIEPGSLVHTDGWSGYSGVKAKGYQHQVSIMKKEGQDCLPRVHLVISLLKRWILGTHQGAISKAHLEYYLDEFTFRFNRRTSGNRGKLFHRLIEQAVMTEPVTFAKISKHSRPYVGNRKR